jgi:hypothetical protein
MSLESYQPCGICQPYSSLVDEEKGCRASVLLKDKDDVIHKPVQQQISPKPPTTFKRKCGAGKSAKLGTFPKSSLPTSSSFDEPSICIVPLSKQDVPDDDWSRNFLMVYELSLD